jgi:uncharacterized protein YuzE
MIMTAFPYVRVDLSHRVLSVVLNDRKVHKTRQLDDAHLVDVDASGEAVAIEILALDNWKIDEMAESFGFSEQVTAIKDAIDRVLTPTGTGVSYGEPIVVPAKVIVTAEGEPNAESDTPTWVIN